MWWCAGGVLAFPSHPCAHILQNHTEYNLILFAMQCCRAIICLLSFIFQPPAICYFYSALVLHTLHPYSHYCVFMQGYFRPCLDRSRKDKREVAPAWYAAKPDTFQDFKGCSVSRWRRGT